MPDKYATPEYEQKISELETVTMVHARLEDNTPVIHSPAAVLSAVDGTQLTGTIIVVDDTIDIIEIDCRSNQHYYHNVRNVKTYDQEAEATWAVLNLGDPVYYDRSATMPATCWLSTSPLDNTGAANPLFGYVGLAQTETPDYFQSDRNPYPTTTATATTETDICIIQK